jgi:hypothetical protein
MVTARRISPKVLVACGLVFLAVLAGTGIRWRESYCCQCAVTRTGYVISVPGTRNEVRIGSGMSWGAEAGSLSLLLADLLKGSRCSHRWVHVSDMSIVRLWLERAMSTCSRGRFPVQQQLVRGQLSRYTSTVSVLARHDPPLAIAVARSLISPYPSAAKCDEALHAADQAWATLMDEGAAQAIPKLRRLYSVEATDAAPE